MLLVFHIIIAVNFNFFYLKSIQRQKNSQNNSEKMYALLEFAYFGSIKN